jgi:CarD family transcriptional regulator
VLQVGTQVVYGIHGVCTIVDTEVRRVDRKNVEFLVLEPRDQPGARFYVPAHNPAALSKLRPLLSAEELEQLLLSDATHQDCWIPEEGLRKQKYRDLLNGGDRAALISMIRQLHKHRESQLAAGRKFHLCDENFLRDANKLLVSEFSMVLERPKTEVMNYIEKIIYE